MRTPEGIEVTEIDVPGSLGAQIESTCGTGPGEIGAAIGSAFQKLGGYVGKHGLTMVSPPRAIYLRYGNEETTFVSAFPIAPPSGKPPEDQGVRWARSRRAPRAGSRTSVPTTVCGRPTTRSPSG